MKVQRIRNFLRVDQFYKPFHKPFKGLLFKGFLQCGIKDSSVIYITCLYHEITFWMNIICSTEKNSSDFLQSSNNNENLAFLWHSTENTRELYEQIRKGEGEEVPFNWG